MDVCLKVKNIQSLFFAFLRMSNFLEQDGEFITESKCWKELLQLAYSFGDTEGIWVTAKSNVQLILACMESWTLFSPGAVIQGL